VSDIIVPSDRDNTHLPLFAAFGLTEAESNAVYFSVTQDMIPVEKTAAGCLLAISEKKGWSDKQKIWAAYNLKIDMLVAKGVPRVLINKLGE